jgi:nucleotide-binding universal stress UspA family protein
MLQRIMVPLDGSTFAEAALPTAFLLARGHASRLDLVRVHQPPPPVVAGPGGDPLYDPALDRELDREGRRYLDVLLGRIGADDRARAVTAYLYGPVAECLSRYVRDQAIDLVVMTTHARGGVSRAWLGSVADGLVRHSPAPVLLLRPGQEAASSRTVARVFRRVLLPVDGAAAEDRMIEHAIAVTGTSGVEYTLLRVVATGAPSVRTALPRRGEDPGSRVQRATVEATLDAKAEALAARGLRVHPQVVVDDDAADGILRYTAENGFDLVAMATRSRGGIERLLLGSVADRVLRNVETALLLWNPGHPSALDLTGAPGSFEATPEPARPLS